MVNSTFINALHIIIIAPLLFYIAFKGHDIPQKWLKLLSILAVYVIVYHGYQIVKNRVEPFKSFDILPNGTKVHYIRMFDSKPGYSVPVIKIKKNDVIVWLNSGHLDHTVTAYNREFNSGYMKPGETFTIQFTKEGVFPYFCILHWGWMYGTVIVE